ncbi:metal ABC transporter permease [Deinococcus peraridilitoris]|uniref:ABC-type Mn2+/Zn2+ transport system, permease component n=1 Tax=Deinococcus peraridilitoris (strain DSM 19664 / LMG 22246 / CIP 109416 / KR-200) TaxID=937777 RepID=L0A8B1_DEIPD|nr:metal ABC transporter permease [Deinococcus peraridilitoris]AFZ69649.1 ABC-type Mn2+/Zn2+ transport system, permease component [Deinococcus peraridilitoris DSM 19664]
MNADLVIVLTACLVAVAGSLVGVFLVLRRLSMISDAISHSVLPGIVAAFWFSGGEAATLPALIGAAAMGLLTVVAVELLVRSGRVKNDAAIGVVFPLLFSIGVILISMYFRNAHLDLDAVLYGEIAYAPFNNMLVFGRELPESLVLMGILALLNAVFVSVFFKELRLSTFDAGLAASLGFAPGVLHYALMTLLSFTTVGAFEAVGAVLIVAFVIVPPASAYLLTRKLAVMLALSLTIGVLSSILGYFLAVAVDASIAGMIASMLGLVFFLCLLFSPLDGVLATLARRQRQRDSVAARQLVAYTAAHGARISLHEAMQRFEWNASQIRRAQQHARRNGWLTGEGETISLTPRGSSVSSQGHAAD